MWHERGAGVISTEQITRCCVILQMCPTQVRVTSVVRVKANTVQTSWTFLGAFNFVHIYNLVAVFRLCRRLSANTVCRPDSQLVSQFKTSWHVAGTCAGCVCLSNECHRGRNRRRLCTRHCLKEGTRLVWRPSFDRFESRLSWPQKFCQKDISRFLSVAIND